MQQQIITMLELQDAMNSKVNPDWRDRGHAWYRAIWVECAELLDHYGWKWWKKQQPDIDQVKLELIDIWHFGLSILLLESTGTAAPDLAKIAHNVEQALRRYPPAEDFRLDLEAFAADTLQTRGFNVSGFARLMDGIQLGFEELYTRYVGKNVLNFFRQDKGYKEGTYIKQWSGREDNEHLAEIIAALDSHAGTFKDDLYRALDQRYAQCL